MASRKVSRWWVASDLVKALESGKTFAEWVDGRIPVASYGRITSDSKKDKHGVKDQAGHNRRHAKIHGLAIVKFYDDNDANAAKADVVRDAFELMIREIGQRRTDEGFPIRGVMVLERERLYRRAGDYERAVDALTVDDDGILYESGDPGRFFDLYAESAEFEGLIGVAASKREVRKSARRKRDWHMARAVSGEVVGGRRRFGYQDAEWHFVNGEKTVVRRSNEKAHPEEWPHLRRMIGQAVAGKAWLTIAEDLNARGVRTALGNEWSAEAVRNVVANPMVYGYRVKGEEIVCDENGKPVIGTWDKAGTPAQWQAIRDRIHQARGQKGLPVNNPDYSPGSLATRTRSYLFSGFLRCGRSIDGKMCNHKLSGKPREGNRWHYGCRKKGNSGCGRLGRDGERVDEYLTELVLQKHEELEAFAARMPKGSQKWEKSEELAAAEQKLARFTEEWHNGVVSDSRYYTDLPRLEGNVKRLHRELLKFQAGQEKKAAHSSAGIRQRWEEMDLTQKRAAIGQVLSAVIVLPLPPGTPKSGPFNPDLLRPVWKTQPHGSLAEIESAEAA